MASTSKDLPVAIANKYEETCLSESEIEMKSEYNEKLHDYFMSTRNLDACSITNKNCLDQFIITIKIEEEKARQNSNYINNFRDKFKIFKSKDGKDCLLIKQEDGKYKMLLPWEDIFDVFWKTHIKYCHPANETLKNILQDDYIVDDFMIQNIREVCYTCSGMKKPYYRLALDILSMAGRVDCAFSHIMICQDICTGFIHLRPLSVDNKESEICVELLRIFMDFGPPKEVVISSNIFEVAIEQIKHLTTFAPISISIFKVKPDLQKSLRLKNRILTLMKKNNVENWGIACYGIQLHLNNESKGIRIKSPYASVFKKIESRVIEVMPEMDVQIDEGVTITSPVDSNAIRCMSGNESAKSASPGTSSSEEEQLITDEIIAGTEIEFNAASDDEILQLEDNDPLAFDESFNL